jgi:LysM repeat protein
MHRKIGVSQVPSFLSVSSRCDTQGTIRGFHPLHFTSCLTGYRAVIFLVLFIVFPFLCASHAGETEKDTFSISLVQEATVKKSDTQEAAIERYTVKKGDHLWKILRDKGLLQEPNIAELLTAIKGMNKSLINLDLIHPGQTILIPLKVVPKGMHGGDVDEFFQQSVMGISLLKDVDIEKYVVKPGDSVSKVVYARYKMPPDYLYNEYLDLVQMFNPTMKDVDLIYPNQVIRLPIYSPEFVKMPIERPPKTGLKEKLALKKFEDITLQAQKPLETLSLRGELREIFNRIGEEWVDTGEQFIPLKSGGHVNLKADSFPTLNVRNGRMLIIDINNELPEDITKLIESDWEQYRVVHLAPHDNLKTAVDKILAACAYYQVLPPGEKIKLRSHIDITLAGDWVIIPQKGEGGTPGRIVTLALIGNQAEQTPPMVKAYLDTLGVAVIDYPDFRALKKAEETNVEKLIPIEKDTAFPLPTLLLNLAGQPFSRAVKIPVYQSGSAGFSLIIHADIFFNKNGKDSIIDMAGLSPDIIDLLTKHKFHVLSLAGEKDPGTVTERVLEFLGLEYESKPHDFLTSARDESRNITLTIQGISFHDQQNRKILAIDNDLPEELISFLNQRGYYLLELSQLEDQ